MKRAMIPPLIAVYSKGYLHPPNSSRSFIPAGERLFAELPQRLSGRAVQSPAGRHFVSGIGFLPNHCIRPQLSHINVAAVRLAQSNPMSVIPEVFNMAEPFRNSVFLQWLHTISSSPILYSQDFLSDMASTAFYLLMQHLHIPDAAFGTYCDKVRFTSGFPNQYMEPHFLH